MFQQIQNPWKEINQAALSKLGIAFVRRRSGGGTVYHVSHPRLGDEEVAYPFEPEGFGKHQLFHHGTPNFIPTKTKC